MKKGTSSKAATAASRCTSSAVSGGSADLPLMDISFAELQEEYGYSRDLLWFRKSVYEQFKI